MIKGTKYNLEDDTTTQKEIEENLKLKKLRKEAEAKVNNVDLTVTNNLNPDQINSLIHELRVHQIELEMQNDEFKKLNEELYRVNRREASIKYQYIKLYDFAPVGYFTIAENGIISMTNYTSATLLKEDKENIVNRKLNSFIHFEDQDIYYLHNKKLFETSERQICQLKLKRNDSYFWASVESILQYDEKEAPVSWTIITDISKSRLLEAELLRALKY